MRCSFAIKMWLSVRALCLLDFFFHPLSERPQTSHSLSFLCQSSALVKVVFFCFPVVYFFPLKWTALWNPSLPARSGFIRETMNFPFISFSWTHASVRQQPRPSFYRTAWQSHSFSSWNASLVNPSSLMSCNEIWLTRNKAQQGMPSQENNQTWH